MGLTQQPQKPLPTSPPKRLDEASSNHKQQHSTPSSVTIFPMTFLHIYRALYRTNRKVYVGIDTSHTVFLAMNYIMILFNQDVEDATIPHLPHSWDSLQSSHTGWLHALRKSSRVQPTQRPTLRRKRPTKDVISPLIDAQNVLCTCRSSRETNIILHVVRLTYSDRVAGRRTVRLWDVT